MTSDGEHGEHGEQTNEGVIEHSKPTGNDTSISSLSSIEHTESNVETNENTVIKKISFPQSFESKTNFYDSLSPEAVATATAAAAAAAAARMETELEGKSNSFTPVNKKPVKFTVRKVSHETIKSPSNLPSISRSPSLHPKNKTHRPLSEANFNNNETKPDKLKSAQSKYDLSEEKLIKIEKEIEFLEKLLPPYNVEIDYTTRNKITRAIERLKIKKDEIKKQQYELGIIISRLWREQEGSDIWVKRSERITG